MNILLKTRCTKGHLIVYEDKVSIEMSLLGSHNENSLPYSQITGCEVKTTMAEIPILSKGAATVKVYGLGDQKLEAPFVTLKEAKKAKELIDARVGKGNAQSGGVGDLEKLAELKDKGIITQEEFEQKKKQLLGL
ncbi:SHOCT domain-containing protein [Candidatus Daviesbacteria bacterium]|nr:SHOCT domain-containing protein [Candidatus Daviesbacteria bacterium]